MRKFKTESKKLLDLMINSIYTNHEIFLRELVSNASDAIDKLYLKSLTDSSVQVDQANLAINVAFDKDARTITVSDNGIGMTSDELEKNLGTIAHSGSEEFKAENAQSQGDAVDIIGRFGVGFYSAFMVAKEVSVTTRAYGSDECFRWTSDGIEGYTISPVIADDPTYRAQSGSDIVLTLKDNTDDVSYDEFLSEYKLKDLITRYSNYVRYPVKMLVTKSRQKEKPADAGDDYKPEWEDYTELDTVNSMTPIWKKRAADVTKEEYAEFYKSTFHDWADPARTFSLHAEGALEYDALLFIPGQAPFDLYSRDYEKGLELYSSNVLIMEKCADLVPDYYNFVRGVVDSSDVSLNISRETLQQTRQLQAMSRRIEKKITSELGALRDDDREAYEKFFENFGRGLKYGLYQSYGSKKDELADLLLFWSAREEKMVTLAEYAAAMPDGQAAIYYAAGDDRERLAKMPVVKAVLAKGYDVLLCTADVDEFCFQAMRDFEAKGLPKAYESDEAREAAAQAVADGAEPELEDRTLELKNVSAGDLDLATDEEKSAAQEATKANEGPVRRHEGGAGRQGREGRGLHAARR
jgi:molecular chaperone HtpG